MITCQHARQLFDRYLDGELSASLQAELHAHQLSCSACQGELAILEACGDVVALDRCEPRPSESFTDRVLLARRAQVARRPRRWGRAALIVGSPMAAAASILLAISLIMPSTPRPGGGPTAILSDVTKVSKPVEELLVGGASRSDREREEMKLIPEMATVGFDKVAARGVKHTEEIVNTARSGLRELGLLWRQALTEAGDQLVAQRQRSWSEQASPDNVAEHPEVEPDLWAPPSWNPKPADDAADEPRLLPPI